MIHPMEAPVFGDQKERKKQRRYSWSTTDEGDEVPNPVPRASQLSAEMANVLWGGMFQAMSDRVCPTKTVQDALETLVDTVGDGLSLGSSSPTDPNRHFPDHTKFVSLKLIESHMTNKSADMICACVGHDHKEAESGHDHQPSTKPNVLLLRRDEIYDLVLTFDREVHPEVDIVEIVFEPEDRIIGIPAFQAVTFPVRTAPPDAVKESHAFKHWWASYVTIGKKTTVRLHVSHSARVGKWRMKVLTGIKRSDHSKKPERDMSVAFHRLHIAMSPEQLGSKNLFNKKQRRFSKGSFASKEA